SGSAPGNRPKRSVWLDHRAYRQRQLAPPGDVCNIAERADHGDAAPLFGIGKLVRPHRHTRAKERRQYVFAEQRLVYLVIRVRDEGGACRKQLRARRFDLDRSTIGAVEPQAVVSAFTLAILELGLSDRGAKIDIPQGR